VLSIEKYGTILNQRHGISNLKGKLFFSQNAILEVDPTSLYCPTDIVVV
jgi:hypothetical protein